MLVLTLASASGLGGTKGLGIDDSFSVLQHFIKKSTLARKNVSAIRILAAGDINVQWALAGGRWSSFSKRLQVRTGKYNSPLYFVLRSWMAGWIVSVLPLQKG